MQVRCRREGQELVRLGDARGQFRRGRQITDFPARERECLARGGNTGRPLPHAREGQEREMFLVPEDNMLINLITDGIGVMLDCQFRDQLQLRPAENLACRVHRAVHQDQLGLVAECRAKLRLINLPVRRIEADKFRNPAGKLDHRQVAIIEWLKQDHLVTRIDQAEHAGRQRLRRAGGNQHIRLPIDAEAVEPRVVRGYGLPKLRDAHHRRILVRSFLSRPGGGMADIGRTILIGETLPQVDRLMLNRKLGHHLEDRCPEVAEHITGIFHARSCQRYYFARQVMRGFIRISSETMRRWNVCAANSCPQSAFPVQLDHFKSFFIQFQIPARAVFFARIIDFPVWAVIIKFDLFPAHIAEFLKFRRQHRQFIRIGITICEGRVTQRQARKNQKRR